MDENETGVGIIGLVVASLLALVIGAFVGGLTTFVHGQWVVPLGGISVPWGLVAGLAILGAVTVGFRLAFGSRIVAGGAAIGIILAVAILSLKSPGGSVLVQNDALGWGWSIGAAVVVVLAVGWPGLWLRRGGAARGEARTSGRSSVSE